MTIDMDKKSEIYDVIRQNSNIDTYKCHDNIKHEYNNDTYSINNKQLSVDMLHNSIENISGNELISPKLISCIRKLNVDIPDIIDDNYDKGSTNVNDKIIDIDNNLYKLKLSHEISPYYSSDQMKLLKSYSDKQLNIDIGQMPVWINNKIISTKFDSDETNIYSNDICLSSLSNKLKSNNDIDDIDECKKNILPSKFINSNLYDNNNNDNNQIHVSMNESLIVYDNLEMNDNLSSKCQWWKFSLIKCYEFSCWLANNIFIQLIKTKFQRFYRLLLQHLPESSTIKQLKKYNNDLIQLTSIIHNDNENVLGLFTEKFNVMAQELNQVNASNKINFAALKNEIDNIKEITNKLTYNNETLDRQLLNLSKKLDETIQINSTILSRFNGSILSLKSSSIPPTPPPLPPSPSSHSLLITPKSTRNSNRTSRIPLENSSTTLMLTRPLITVEDLRNVTLKKPSQTNKENNPRNNVEVPRGPVISLDMLRSVKLKSTRHNRNNTDVNNAKSPHRTFRSCAIQGFSVSPIMSGGESPLYRILKQMDNKRELKKALMTSSCNDNELTENNSKQFHVTSPSKSSHTIIV